MTREILGQILAKAIPGPPPDKHMEALLDKLNTKRK